LKRITGQAQKNQVARFMGFDNMAKRAMHRATKGLFSLFLVSESDHYIEDLKSKEAARKRDSRYRERMCLTLNVNFNYCG